MSNLRANANTLIERVIQDNLPDKAVKTALLSHCFGERNIYMVAIGKAAWTMAKAASDFLGHKIIKGIVITKYGHTMGDIPRTDIYEAGHPTLDENTLYATQQVLSMVGELNVADEVLFLVSGGGSALFESLQDGVSLNDLTALTGALLESGANIVEINTIRKRLSRVKAGRFAEACKPAKVFSIVLSDVLGDRLDTIASGPAAPDTSTCHEAMDIVEKYALKLTPKQMVYLQKETSKDIDNVETVITGSVRVLCETAVACALSLGFTPYVLTTSLSCEAASAGEFLAAIASDTQKGHTHYKKPCAIIAGGETVVRVKGSGKGGRNQELALSAAKGIAGLGGIVIFSLGSDGTDGPTDAAGGLVDGTTTARIAAAGLNIDEVLANNDSYNGLMAAGGLIITGPTGTNVNDVIVVLCE